MTKPNLVYIFCDQFRRQAIGYMGEDPVVTPHLDQFAREGVVFNQAVSNYPVCSPYRGILLTGLYPHKNHIFTNCNSKSAPKGCYLREDQLCLSDILSENGYELGYIGKWHLD
ncbi:sulfatase-like hydrolase/transferase, partial [Zhenhengia yiwuensis]|uniref:sulfatase-like hydrolase/transferase n=1 Tax=Zhenhengia yiwuensis TaxID=2763666 RepID=UPI002A765FBE